MIRKEVAEGVVVMTTLVKYFGFDPMIKKRILKEANCFSIRFAPASFDSMIRKEHYNLIVPVIIGSPRWWDLPKCPSGYYDKRPDRTVGMTSPNGRRRSIACLLPFVRGA